MNRREFLKRTATAAAIAAVVPSALVAAAKPSMFIGKQGVFYDRVLVLGPERLEAIDLYPPRKLVWSRETLKEVREITPRRT